MTTPLNRSRLYTTAMARLWVLALFIVLLYAERSECTCLTELCTQTTGLAASMLFGNFTTDTCEDLKSYVHCLTSELAGCVGESGQRTALMILAEMHYLLVHRRCEYYGSNGICDESDCTYVADISEGYTSSICDRMRMFIACLKIELGECGTGSIYGSLVQSEIDGKELIEEQFCSSTRADIFFPVLIGSIIIYFLTS